MNMLPQEPMAHELDDVADRAERGRAFFFMFPGSGVSDRWLQDFEHVDTPAHGGTRAHESATEPGSPADRRPR